MILFGEASLRHALTHYVEHYHHERNHQGKGNVLLFPLSSQEMECGGPIQCRERLGGLLKYLSLSRLSCKCIQGLANRELRHKRWRPRCLLAWEACKLKSG